MLTTLQALLRRTRQHHAIEHAMLTILAERFPGRRMVGYSDPIGVTILTDLPEAAVQQALSDAMLRLQAGEAQLAIHPNCGTNLLATGVLVTLASLFAGLGSRKDLLSRFSRTLTLVLPMLIVGPMIGLQLQQYTTLAAVSDRWVKAIFPFALGPVSGFRIIFE